MDKETYGFAKDIENIKDGLMSEATGDVKLGNTMFNFEVHKYGDEGLIRVDLVIKPL